jgi:hypothetical protein
LAEEEKTFSYCEKHLAVIVKQIVVGLGTLLLGPFLSYWTVDPLMIWGARGLMEAASLATVYFMAWNLLSPFLGL